MHLEKRVLLDKYGKWLWVMRRQPWHAAFWLSGSVLPSHERFWLGVYFGETKDNNVIASRGTSKSFTHASLAAPLKGLLFKNVSTLCFSASGFRGGKELFKDAERLVLGQLKSQEPPGVYLHASVAGAKVIQKDPSIWTISFRSNSRYSTVPTNNPDQLRGLRGTEVLVDERNTFPGAIVQNILRPMLNVGTDFRRTATGGDQNKIYQISTIDYTVRDWYPEIQVAQQLQRKEYAAWQARRRGQWDEYDRLMNENDGQLAEASFSLTRIDYTDLLIPEHVATLDGQRRYRVAYPMERGVKREDILKVDKRRKTATWYTYPVDVGGLEKPLRDGTTDKENWLAEQRNVFISSSGNVFDFDLIQRVSERPIPTPGAKRRKAEDDEDAGDDEFYAPVLYACGDPCVLGVDVARESDETTFVVIRLGELAETDFSPFVPRADREGRPTLGRTDWNHICWAESWRKLQAHDAAEKVRDLRRRFHIIRTVQLGGIGMDARASSAVRDDLADPKPRLVDGLPDPDWSVDKVVRIYDPHDEDFKHYSALNDPTKYWDGLRRLATTNQDNLDWTYGARGLMQAKKLYIAFWMPPSRWAYEKGLLKPNGEPDKQHPEYKKWEVGYTGIRRLKSQLIRLQQKVSEQGVVRFTMPGNRDKESGKKDLWAGMIYGVAMARDHLNARTQPKPTVPSVEPILIVPSDPFGGEQVLDNIYRKGNW